MALKSLGLAIAALAVVALTAPASAEFFGCNEPRSKVSYSSSSSRHAYERTFAPSRSQDHASYAGHQRTRSAGLFAPVHSRNDRW